MRLKTDKEILEELKEYVLKYPPDFIEKLQQKIDEQDVLIGTLRTRIKKLETRRPTPRLGGLRFK